MRALSPWRAGMGSRSPQPFLGVRPGLICRRRAAILGAMDTRTAIVGLAAAAVCLLAACRGGETPSAPSPRRAVALLEPRSGSEVAGNVALTEAAGGRVEVVVTATGLTPGDHGIHIHEKGDCSAADAASAGGHFDPDGAAHGAPGAMPHHAGDFGNLTADAGGRASRTYVVDFITLDDGPRSAIGRAFVVHADPDDLTSQPSGNSGARVACGVITAQ